MDWQDRMKTYSPNQYATMTGMDYNPHSKTFTPRDRGGNEQDAAQRIAGSYSIGGTAPVESQAAKWYSNIGSKTQQFNFATAYANAKTKVSQTLNSKGQIGLLAVNDSPFYDWLKTKNLDRGIL